MPALGADLLPGRNFDDDDLGGDGVPGRHPVGYEVVSRGPREIPAHMHTEMAQITRLIHSKS